MVDRDHIDTPAYNQHIHDNGNNKITEHHAIFQRERQNS